MLITKWIFVIMLHFHNLYLHVLRVSIPSFHIPSIQLNLSRSFSFSFPPLFWPICLSFSLPLSPFMVIRIHEVYSHFLLSFFPLSSRSCYFSLLPNSHHSLCSSLSVFQFHFQETVPPPRPEISIHPTTSNHFTYLPHFSLYTLS